MTHATFNSGLAYVCYDPFHKALWVGGPDEHRMRWIRDGWVKTVTGHEPGNWPADGLATPSGKPKFTWGNVAAVDARGRIYITTPDGGVWRAYNRKEVTAMTRDSCFATPRLVARVAAAARCGAEGRRVAQSRRRDHGLRRGPGQDVRGTPHVAFGKGVYLAVWREGWNGEGGTARILAARLDRQGRVLDPRPLEVAPCQDGFQELPRVAFGGGVFLVVWQDFRNGRDDDVLGARISPEGKVLDAQPIAIAAGPRTQSVPDVASDGQAFLVVWQAVQGEDNVYRVGAARVGADGGLGTAVEIKSPWTKAGACPRIAWDGTNYRVLFVSHSLLSVRLAPDGSPLDKDPVVTLRGNLGTAIRFAHSVAAAPGGAAGRVHALAARLLGLGRTRGDDLPAGRPGRQAGRRPPAGRLSAEQAGQLAGLRQGEKRRQPLALRRQRGGLGREAVCRRLAAAPHPEDSQPGQLRHPRFARRRLEAAGRRGSAVAATELEEKNPALAADGAGKLLCLYERHSQDGQVAIVGRLLEAADSTVSAKP